MSVRTRASSPAGGGGMQYALYLYDIFNAYNVVHDAYPADVILFVPIQIKEAVTIDRLICICWDNWAGNVRMALYPDNGFMPDGSALIVETASVAVVNGKNELPIPNTSLTPGLYWLAQNRDNVNPSWKHYEGGSSEGGTVQGRFVAFAYGAFPAVCPVTAITEATLCKWVRVASIP